MSNARVPQPPPKKQSNAHSNNNDNNHPILTHLVRHQHARGALEDARVGEALPENVLPHVRVHGAEDVVPGVLVGLVLW